jgi:hypothetical protein
MFNDQTHQALADANLDYSLARPIGNEEWERVVGDDCQVYENGATGPVDMFDLEISGWCSLNSIEFKRK